MGNPQGLANALAKTERLQGNGLERIFLSGGNRVPEPLLFRTHPDADERIRRLLELEEITVPPLEWPVAL